MNDKEKVEALKRQINSMSYTELLDKWRHAPVGSPFFSGEVGDYYAEVMKRKQAEVGHAAAVAASKAIGWGGAS